MGRGNLVPRAPPRQRAAGGGWAARVQHTSAAVPFRGRGRAAPAPAGVNRATAESSDALHTRKLVWSTASPLVANGAASVEWPVGTT